MRVCVCVKGFCGYHFAVDISIKYTRFSHFSFDLTRSWITLVYIGVDRIRYMCMFFALLLRQLNDFWHYFMIWRIYSEERWKQWAYETNSDGCAGGGGKIAPSTMMFRHTDVKKWHWNWELRTNSINASRICSLTSNEETELDRDGIWFGSAWCV